MMAAAKKVKKATAEKTIKTFPSGGPGKKECPSCGKFVGVKSPVCVCGHEFPAPKPAKLKKVGGSDNSVLAYVLAQKGFDESKLAELGRDTAVQFLIASGSAEAAKKAIDAAEKKLAAV